MEMKKQKELLIIMPAYNEEKNIEAVLYELEKPEISSIADILVMNDASSDSTNWDGEGTWPYISYACV